MDLYAAERQLNGFLDRQAAKTGEARPGQAAANEEVARLRARESRRTHNVQLINARAWAAHFGGLALAAHDQAARYSELRDEYAAIARELETNEGKSA